jgi:hypothetical protein
VHHSFDRAALSGVAAAIIALTGMTATADPIAPAFLVPAL